jgi:mannose-6-phosphate isomerase-like protein (cupin superfamily)
MKKIYKDNIEKKTLENSYWRKVLFTTPQLQLVLMSIPPKQDIGEEIHKNTTQFIRIESGHGIAIISGKKYILKDGTALVIPPNTKHNIICTDKEKSLQLYSIYSPPEHPIDIKQKFK